MSEIKGWILGICFAAVVCSLLEMLFPKGTMEKSAKFITALFFLCAMVIPAVSKFQDFKFDIALEQQTNALPSEELDNKVSEQLKRASEQNIERLIKGLLEENEIFPDKISVIMDTGQNGSIEIKGAEILLTDGDFAKQEQVKNLLRSQLGIRAEVTSSQG